MATADEIAVYAHGALLAAADRHFLMGQVDAASHLWTRDDDQARLPGALGPFGRERNRGPTTGENRSHDRADHRYYPGGSRGQTLTIVAQTDMPPKALHCLGIGASHSGLEAAQRALFRVRYGSARGCAAPQNAGKEPRHGRAQPFRRIYGAR